MASMERNKQHLRVCLVSDHTYLPDFIGGRENSIDELARLLSFDGHDVTVIANRGSLIDIPRRLVKRVLCKFPYTVFRVKNERAFAENFLRNNSADFAIYNVAGAFSYISEDADIRKRQIFFIRGARDLTLSQCKPFTDIRFISNSNFIADIIMSKIGRRPFIFPPIIIKDKFKASHIGKNVTFVNPIEEKGLSRALSIAQLLSEFKFLFVEAWSINNDYRKFLLSEINRIGNIELMSETMNPRQIYERTKVLIVPSICEEAFGRVAMEAQINGIPVVATNIGGLPESVGNGGILIDQEASMESWAHAVRSLMQDEILWSSFSTKALLHAETFLELNRLRSYEFIEWLKNHQNH